MRRRLVSAAMAEHDVAVGQAAEPAAALPARAAPAAVLGSTLAGHIDPAGMLALQRAAGNRVARRYAPGNGRAARRVLARASVPEVALAEELAPKLDDDRTAPDAIARLDGEWIQFMVAEIKLLVERHNKKDRLLKFAPARPRVLAALNAVLDPDAAKTGAGLETLSADQHVQLNDFARRREWPTAIPEKGAARPSELDDPLSELNGIIAAIWHERRAVADTMTGRWQVPIWSGDASVAVADRGKKSTLTAEQTEELSLTDQTKKFKTNFRGGYMRSAAGDTRDPTKYDARGNVPAAQKARIEAINKVVWEELGHEGDVGSINTYDDAILTWGKGWAAHGGRLSKLMVNLPQNIKDRLLDIGFAYRGGHWLALAVGDKCVLKDTDALQYVRFNTAILSAMYALGQGDSAQGLADAQAGAIFTEFDQMPQEIQALNDQLIMVIVHCCWWGHMTLGKAKSLTSGVTGTTEQLRAVVRWQADHGSIRSSQSHGANVITGWQANLFNKMGRGVIASTFTERADAPADEHSGKALIKPDGFTRYIVV
jgi:hypothetical protein